jgi:sortase A
MVSIDAPPNPGPPPAPPVMPPVPVLPTPPPPPNPPAVKAARPPMPGGVFVTLASVAALSGVAIFMLAFALGFSALQEQRSQHQLYASYRGLLSPSSPIAAQIGGPISPGAPVALLNSQQAGLHNAIVVQGTSPADLLKGPGHLRDSPLPGQFGQSILLGRSLTAGAPFRGVTNLRKGDVITVTTGQGTFRFVVSDLRIAGSTLPPLPAGGALLTLVTSYGSGWLSHLAPSHVVFVDATLQGKAVSAPADQPVAVPSSELPGRSDPGAWPFLVFWLQALIVSGAGTVWAWVKWSRWQTWLVGAPIILGVLWGLSEEAMRLLPNLM